MLDAPANKIDPLSEILALSTYGATKNIVMTAIEAKGPLDVEAFAQAVLRASFCFPQFTSCLKEIKLSGKHYLVWEPRPGLPLTLTESSLNAMDPSKPLLDHLLQHLEPRLEREWNLFEEIPIECHSVQVSPGKHFLVSMFHHTGSDAATASEFGRRMLLRYHEIVKGERPDWADQSAAISSSGKRKVKIRQTDWKEYISDVGQNLANMMEKPVLPVGSGNCKDPGQHHVKRVLTTEETEWVGKLAARNSASPVDLLAACAQMAVDQWNATRNIPPGLLTLPMTVNTRGRYGGGAPNNSSLIVFKSRSKDRTDPAAFLRSLALTRIKHFRHQEDVKYVRNLETIVEYFRILPFRVRRRIAHSIAARQKFSIAVTLLGALWPMIKNGKPSANSSVTRSGDFSITEVHGLGYKLLSSTHVLLMVYIFDGRLNLILTSSASLFNRQEAEAFLDLFVHNLLKNPTKVLKEP